MLRIRIQDPVPFSPLDPGSGLDFFPDLRSSTHYFKRLETIYRVKCTIILCQLVQIFSVPVQNLNNFRFCKICCYKKIRQLIFYPSSFVALVESGIRDPRSGTQETGWIKSGSWIYMPDPHHCTTGNRKETVSSQHAMQ